MKTRRGIYINIKESEYKHTISGFTFYFSSNTYKEKFIEKSLYYVDDENLKIENKYNVSISLELLLLISFYKQIEKRGFRVYDELNKKEVSPNIMFALQIISY